MNSDTFDHILEKKAGKLRKDTKEKTRAADIFVKLNRKGAKLVGAFEARSTEAFGEGVDQTVLEAASERLDNIINDWTLGQAFFDTEVKYSTKTKVKVPTKVPGLTDKRRRSISGLTLSSILNLTLSSYIQMLMGKGNRLVNRTGRLAHSAQVTGIRFQEKVERQRKNRVSVFFNYMIAPYATFEPSGKQHKPGRSPSKLIKEALTLALKRALSKQSFKNHIFESEYKGRRF